MAAVYLGLNLPETPETVVTSRLLAGKAIERVYE